MDYFIVLKQTLFFIKYIKNNLNRSNRYKVHVTNIQIKSLTAKNKLQTLLFISRG